MLTAAGASLVIIYLIDASTVLQNAMLLVTINPRLRDVPLSQ